MGETGKPISRAAPGRRGERTLFAAHARGDAPEPGAVFVRVAVERGLDRGGGGPEVLTYRVPEQPVALVRVGQRVMVPLGRATKLVGGCVVEVGGAALLGDVQADRVRMIAEVDDRGVPAALVELGVWMASYYVAPLGLVLAGMMPAAVKRGAGTRRVVMARVAAGACDIDLASMPSRARTLAEHVLTAAPRGHGVPLAELAESLGLVTPARLRALAKRGVLELFEETRVIASSRSFDPLAPDGGAAEEADARPPAPGGFHAVAGGAKNPSAPFALTGGQQHAITGLCGHVVAQRFSAHLLLGVTGSGKTEVYLQLIERALALGKSGLVLVPEIALTPQTSGRFVERFGAGLVSVLHSGLSASRRHQAWERVSRGEARVVVGARSAVFAPLRDLGVIIVDEEHDTSYKQGQTPRYHGRDVAIKRASIEGCPVVLGSATPSLESYASATHADTRGATRFALYRLPTRVPGAAMPAVKIVDLREERKLRAASGAGDAFRQHLLGPTLEHALDATLRAGGQAMMLLNRRGLGQHLSCPSPACKFVVMCDGCDASLVVHKHGAAPVGTVVRCHHCLTDTKTPALCPSCGKKLLLMGGGTQKLEDELCRKFASLGINEHTVLRVDSDTMHGARDYYRAMERFRTGNVRVLVGTQMIAKGLDFSNVRLVGVIDADTALAIPDFRSAERTHQLVSQVAGRAGRGAHAGMVFVQTWTPDNRAIVLAATHDFEKFASGELEVRRRAMLPPASRLARITVTDKSAITCGQRAGALVESLRASEQVRSGHARVDDASPCLVARVAHEHRMGINIFAEHAGVLRAVLGDARGAGTLGPAAKISVDVDPVMVV